MGQNAFVESYKKPNYRLHVVVFLAIVATSVFLASQVEKTKDNADIAALKNPVPIDSIAIESDTEASSINKATVPTIKAPVVNRPVDVNEITTITETITETDQEYVFESDDNLEDIRSKLLADTETPNITQDSENQDEMDSTTVLAEAESKSSQALSQENNQVTDNQAPTIDLMDKAYQQQQDRFLQTLAKSAQIDTTESIEIKKLKAAIREDKPLSSETKTTKKVEPKKVATSPKTETSVQGNQPSVARAKTTQAQTVAVKMQLPDKFNTHTSVIKNANRVNSAPKPSLPQLTKGELNKIVNQFAWSYNNGDINRLMALFADNATTNDQSNKLGIKADYTALFSNTKNRKLMIKDIKWQLGKDRAEGAADFIVTVQPNNSVERNQYRGYIKITAIKQYKDVYITRLIHELK